MFHHHKWAITHVQNISVYESSRSARPSGSRTEVSLVCQECGKPKVKKLRGTWKPR